MTEFRTIEVDFEVHKRIEMDRRNFAETPNEVLRRLLGIDSAKNGGNRAGGLEPAGRSWSGKGVSLPHGSLLRMKYNGKQHFGEINNGEWLVEGKRYRSPSAAAGGVAITKSGAHPSLDGWIYWDVKRPGEDGWIPISELRRLVRPATLSAEAQALLDSLCLPDS
jgi:hypothetical protein